MVKHAFLYLMLFVAACCSSPPAASAQPMPVSLLRVHEAALVSRAGLHYIRPVKRSEEGLPVGNGRTGGLVWTTASSINTQLNRVDVFASPSGSNSFFERNTDYCGGTGAIAIDFGGDVFTAPQFQEDLSCYDGLVTVAGKGVKASILVWKEQDVMALHVHDSRSGAGALRIDLAMLRPPLVRHHMHTALSVFDTTGEGIALVQRFSEEDYYCGSALAIGATAGTTVAPLNDTAMSLLVHSPPSDFTIYIASAASFDPDKSPLAAARNSLRAARKAGFQRLLSSNQAWWHRYWSKAFIHLHSRDGVADDLEKNYTYYLYVMAASSLGKYPPKFNGMLWTTGGDLRKWGSAYWGANQSCLYNAVFPTNRMALTDPMFDMYSGMYAACSLAARQQWGSKGIYIPETVAFNGPEELPGDIATEMQQLYLLRKAWEQRSRRFTTYANTKSPFLSRWNWKARGRWDGSQWLVPDRGSGPYGPVTHIFSRGAKIAYQYWQRFEYSLDTAWLKERAYPMLKGIAEFYRNFPNLRKDEDGVYSIMHVNDNEPVWNGRNTVEEISAMKGVFPAAIKASTILGADETLRAQWKEVLTHLSALPRSSDSLLPGEDTAAITWIKSEPPVDHGRYDALPDQNTLPTWFFDLCNPGVAHTQRLKIAETTFDAYFKNGIHPNTQVGVLSRLAVAGTILGRTEATRYLIPSQLHSAETPSLPNRMDEREGYQTTGIERIGRVSEALQNALCQSAPPTPGGEPIIRVFPAWPPAWEAQFTLLCRHGFLVSSSMAGGQIKFVEIYSKKGATCTLINPWGGPVDIYKNGVLEKKWRGKVLRFTTAPSDHFIMVPEGANPRQLPEEIL